MYSRTFLTAVGIGTWLAVALTAAPRVNHRHSTNMRTDNDGPMKSCSDLHIEFDGREAVVQSEEKTISKSQAGTLHVEAESNGGLQVQGWDGDNYSVTLCKAAEPGNDADQILSQIKLNIEGGQVSVTGPSHDRDDRDWSAYLLVRAPKGAMLSLNVNNGPVSVYGVQGNITAKAVNGPVSMKDANGNIDLTAENGPISVDGISGKVHLRTQNGPVDVNLSGQAWTGEGVDAHATNGPVTVRVPQGYKSGVVVESDGNGPFSCHASVCSEGRKTWDDDHKRIEFGTGPVLVRVSTVNGPVSVE